jgi:uncharacterized RDD family membrane protein YckC
MDDQGFPAAARPSRAAISVWPRAMAFAIDAVAIAVVAFAPSLDGNAAPSWWLYGVTPGFAFVYFVLCERFDGATLGKKWRSIEVRTLAGGNIGWQAAIVRSLVRYIDLALLPVSVALVALSPRHRSLADRAAGTAVVSSHVSASVLFSDGTHAHDQPVAPDFVTEVQSEIGRPPHSN